MSRDDAVRAAAEAYWSHDIDESGYGVGYRWSCSCGAGGSVGTDARDAHRVTVAVDAAAPHLTADLVREREALAEVKRLREVCESLAKQHSFCDSTATVRAEKAEAEVERLRGLLDGPDCTCGYGGYHEETNPRCARNALRGDQHEA